MRGLRRSSWQRDLEALVDHLLELQEPGSNLVGASIEQARRADPGNDGDVTFALGQLFRIADGLGGSEAELLALAEVMALAIASFAETKKPDFVTGVAKQLQRRGTSELGLNLLEDAFNPEIVEPFDRPAAVTGALLNERGELLRAIGRLNEAEGAFTEALAALDDESGSHDAERSVVLNNLGLVYSGKGDLSEAKRYLLESLTVDDRRGAAPLVMAITLDNLGVLEADLAKEAGPLWLDHSYVNAIVDEHLRQAEAYFERAGELFESALPKASDDYVISLLNYASAAAQRGDRDTRARLSARGMEIATTPGRVSIGTMWDAVALRGDVMLEGGEPQAAVELLTSWFDRLMPEMESNERVSRGLTTLLRAAAKVSDQDLVNNVAATIADIDTDLLPYRLVGGSEAESRAAFAGFKNRTDLIIGHCLPQTPTGIAPLWLYELVLNRKGVLAERQGSSWLRARDAEGIAPDLLAQVSELRSEVARLDLDGSGSTAIQAARQRHEEAERRLGKIEAQLQHELDPHVLTIPRVAPAEVQAHLQADTTLLDFVTIDAPDGSTHYALFLVGADGPVRFRDLGQVDEVDRRLRALVADVARPPAADGDGQLRQQWAHEPATVLFDPGDVVTERLLVSPTGTWGLIPFSLLPDEAGEPLINGHVVTLVPSGRWIVTHAAAAAEDDRTTGPSAVLGDPDFDLHLPHEASSYLTFRLPQLENTGVEAREVAGLLGVAPAIEGEATRQRLLDVRRPRILHVASHGVFLEAIGSLAEMSEPRESTIRSVGGTVVSEDSNVLGWSYAGSEDNPDDARALHRSRVRWLSEIGPAGQLSRSGLLLAGFNAWLAGVTTPPDVGMGVLSAGEFALLDLATTELVVLSACETGVGAVDWADGSLLGLRTSALSAGAASCMSTLWNVEDETAAMLVSVFYTRLASGDERGASLHAAQLAIRLHHPDPYFWAGWVMEGATGRIDLVHGTGR
jgi:CHAT domain-containing protein